MEEEFFGKFILCSNNETTFVKIDKQEIRYWVRKVPSLKDTNDKLLEDLKTERFSDEEIESEIYDIESNVFYLDEFNLTKADLVLENIAQL